MKKGLVIIFLLTVSFLTNESNAVEECCGLTSPGNVLQCGPHIAGNGNCTWYAAHKRPEVIKKCTGMAKKWLEQARAGRLPVGGQPYKGSIGVFNSWGYDTEGNIINNTGHVLYVESINEDGTFDATEMGWNTWNCIHRPNSFYSNESFRGIIGYIFPKNCQGCTDPEEQIHYDQRFMDAFLDNGGECLFGESWDNGSGAWVHQWPDADCNIAYPGTCDPDAVWLQDYINWDDDGHWWQLVLNPDMDEVFPVHGQILTFWHNNWGYRNHGSPASYEYNMRDVNDDMLVIQEFSKNGSIQYLGYNTVTGISRTYGLYELYPFENTLPIDNSDYFIVLDGSYKEELPPLIPIGQDAPKSDFTYGGSTRVYMGSAIKLINTSSGEIEGCEWTLGHGMASTDWDVTRIFTSAGFVNISLRVFNSDSESIETVTFKVLSPDTPENYDAFTADFILSTYAAYPEQNVNMIEAEQDYSNVFWGSTDWGDGTIYDMYSPSHQYYYPGYYLVQHEVYGRYSNDTKRYSQYIQILDPRDEELEVIIHEIGPLEGMVSHEVCALAKSFGAMVEQYIDWGDGSQITQLMPEYLSEEVCHTYTKAGEFTAVLSAMDEDGSISTDSRQITVLGKVYPTVLNNQYLRVEPIRGPVPLVVKFKSRSQPCGFMNEKWINISRSCEMTVTINEPGTHTYRHQALGNFWNTINNTIEITALEP